MRLICAPNSRRTGIFCRFGSVLERRPVAVTVMRKFVCMRPSVEMTLSRPSA